MQEEGNVKPLPFTFSLSLHLLGLVMKEVLSLGVRIACLLITESLLSCLLPLLSPLLSWAFVEICVPYWLPG